MATHWVVKGFDIIKDHGLGLGSGGWNDVVEAFGFKGGPEGFGGGVIVAVCTAAHALIDAELGQCGSEVGTGILAVSIKVVFNDPIDFRNLRLTCSG